MAKIGFSPTVANVKSSTIWDGTSVGNKFIVTGDGYLMVKDKMFRIPLTTTDNTDNIYNLTVSNTDGALSIGAGGFTHDPVSVVIGAANGNMTTASVDKGLLKVDHNQTAGFEAGSVGPSADSSSSITVPIIGYDTYGHIISKATKTATLDTVKQVLLNQEGTYYVLAGKGNAEDADNYAYYNTGVIVDKNGYLHANKLYVGNTDIESLIHASNAMYYEGSVNKEEDLPSSPKNGDTYMVATAGTYKGMECETGDYLIASVKTINGQETVTWTVIQGNVKGAVTTGADAINLTESGIVYATGNKTVSSTAAAVAGQYLSGTEWQNFQTLTFSVGDSSLIYSPYANYEGNKSSIILAGNGVTIGIKDNTITFAAENDNTTYDLFAGTASSTSNESSSTGAYIHLAGSDKTDDLVYLYGDSAASVSAVAPDNEHSFGRIKISATNTTYSHNSLKFQEGEEIKLTYVGGQESTTTAVTKTIKSGGKISFAVADNTLTISSNWREVTVPYIETAKTTEDDAKLGTKSIETALTFGSDFLLTDGGVELAWAEVDENGHVNYL